MNLLAEKSTNKTVEDICDIVKQLHYYINTHKFDYSLFCVQDRS